MDNFLSVIIPVYKVEKYVERCLDSIVSYLADNIEVVLVDDGSPDNSGKICDEYASKYENVKSLHKSNGGLSDARNFGLEHSTGEYVWFVDSDDYIEAGGLERIISDLRENPCDVLVCQAKKVNDDGFIGYDMDYTIPRGLYSNEQYMKVLKNHHESVSFCVPFHICKRELLQFNKLLFYKGILHEDELWTPQVLLKAKNIFYSAQSIYCYYMRDNSITHLKTEKNGISQLFIAETLKTIFDRYEQKDLYYMRDRMVDIYLQAFLSLPSFFERTIWERTVPLKNSFYLKTKLKSFLYFVSPKLYLLIHKITKKF